MTMLKRNFVNPLYIVGMEDAHDQPNFDGCASSFVFILSLGNVLYGFRRYDQDRKRDGLLSKQNNRCSLLLAIAV